MPETTPINFFLRSLPLQERQRLLAQCKHVTLPQKTVLYQPQERPRFVYFLNSGVVSSISMTANGESAEVGVVGREGIVNALLVLGPAAPVTQGLVQVNGTAYQIPLPMLRELFQNSAPLRDCVLHYVQNESILQSRIAGCLRLHTAEQRMARWLLMVQDRIGSDEFRLTQNFLAAMLGTGRPTVTLVLQGMEQRGLVEVNRGLVKIAAQERLEQAACECYRTAKAFLHALYPSTES